MSCPGGCTWKERPRLPGTFLCSGCHTPFPCREIDCGHMDCIDARDKTVCFYCRKPVLGDDPEQNIQVGGTEPRAYYTFTHRGYCKVAHGVCAITAQEAPCARKADPT